MSTLKIGIDTGKSHTKWSVKVDGAFLNKEFPTAKRISAGKIAIDDYLLEYNGNSYVIGERDAESTTTENQSTTKIAETYHLCALTAICQAIRELRLSGTVEVQATINMPFLEFKNGNDRKLIKELYDKQYELIMDGKEYKFNLTVTPYYECLGSTIKHHTLFKKGEEVVVLDMGSLNNGIVLYDAFTGKPVVAKSQTIGLGYDNFKSHLQYEIHETFKKEYSLSQIELIITGHKKVDGAVEEYVTNAVKIHLDKIKGAAKRFNVDLDEVKLICSGGCAKSLKSYIINMFTNGVIIDQDSHFNNSKYTLELIR